jgi:hypothetical protein
LVRSLELSLEDTELPDLTNNHWDEYYLRDMAERFCLMFIHELINKYGTNALIKAKFVEKWLAKQKWGDNSDSRRHNFSAYLALKENRLADIIRGIKNSKRGLRALEGAGLIEKQNIRRRIGELPDIIMEQRLRRQHREAMVLNDGTRPLREEDIIERDHSPT